MKYVENIGRVWAAWENPSLPEPEPTENRTIPPQTAFYNY